MLIPSKRQRLSKDDDRSVAEMMGLRRVGPMAPEFAGWFPLNRLSLSASARIVIAETEPMELTVKKLSGAPSIVHRDEQTHHHIALGS